MLAFPEISPIAVTVFGFPVRWYGLAYCVSIVLATWWVESLERRFPRLAPPGIFRGFLTWGIFGIIVGGRLGHIFLYAPAYYWRHPEEILCTWQGGMAFHGGFLGLTFAALVYTRRKRVSFFSFTDLMACSAPIGLFFVRLANFINQEVYGRVSDLAWAVCFPRGGWAARHPSQLYEAGLEGLCLGLFLVWRALRTKDFENSGRLTAFFLFGYSFARIFCEWFREPEPLLGWIMPAPLTAGQVLTLPLLILGVAVWGVTRKKGCSDDSAQNDPSP